MINQSSNEFNFEMMLYIILSLVVVFSVILFVVLFGDLPSYDDTIIFKARNFLVNECYYHVIVAGLTKLDDKIFGGWIFKTFCEISWVGYWVVPCFYTFVMGECVRQFFKHTFNQLIRMDRSYILISIFMIFGLFRGISQR